ncbi:hypothetical protein V3391_06725 [Luteimonas sp. SMYT11W]|uniref:Uncharacterized protein n=1 Tax=Luteimonas flava TaxID=3115822 RepID=A0ABU7WFD6_9GAMM
MNSELRDISGLLKPKAVLPTIKRIGEYVSTMKGAGKAPVRVTISAKDYDAIMRTLNAARQDHEPTIGGLLYRDLPVERGS